MWETLAYRLCQQQVVSGAGQEASGNRGHTADSVMIQMMCITPKDLLWLFCVGFHLLGCPSYYFLHKAMGGDVCSGNNSHSPDKVPIPSPTFRQWNIKVKVVCGTKLKETSFRDHSLYQQKIKHAVIYLWVTEKRLLWILADCMFDQSLSPSVMFIWLFA